MPEFLTSIIDFINGTQVLQQITDVDFKGLFTNGYFLVPFLALLTGRTSLSFDEIGWRPIIIGIGIYVVLLLLHPLVTGVSPVPF